MSLRETQHTGIEGLKHRNAQTRATGRLEALSGSWEEVSLAQGSFSDQLTSQVGGQALGCTGTAVRGPGSRESPSRLTERKLGGRGGGRYTQERRRGSSGAAAVQTTQGTTRSGGGWMALWGRSLRRWGHDRAERQDTKTVRMRKRKDS